MLTLRRTIAALRASRAFAVGLAWGALLGGFMSCATVQAQLMVEPQSLSVSLPQYQEEVRMVTLTNSGTEALAFCLSFERPLQREGGAAWLAEGAVGGDEPCGDYSAVLYRYDEDDFGAGWDPINTTMVPEGRLFVAEGGGLRRTFEFTPELALVRSFEHPHLAELTPFSGTSGIAYDPTGLDGGGTLWWMNVEFGVGVTRRLLLLEGDLDGVATGGRIEVAPPSTPIEDFLAGGLSYEPAMDLFYLVANAGDNGDPDGYELWAFTRGGTVAEGYPLRPEPYPGAYLNASDVHGGSEGGPGGTPGAEGIRVELGVLPASGINYDRVVVTDRFGNSEGTALETPVPAALFAAGGAGIRGNPLRSRVDRNGLMYMTFTNFDHTGIVGVRPHPLPPSWLVVDSDEGPEAAWDGTLQPGASREIELTFRAGEREVGSYTSSLQAFEAASGVAVEVPLMLEVSMGTAADDLPGENRAAQLSVYPNPFARGATVALSLETAAEVRVAVYDVLGRAVAVLHEGPLPAGDHALRFDGADLPSGLYLVRVSGEKVDLSEQVTVLR